MMKCVVIYNPNSGKLANRNEINKIYKIFENYNYDVEIKYTEYKGHAKEMTKKLKNIDLLICAGGDGTLNEVISGNLERKEPIVMGQLPLGSVNDVAHMYGMTNNTTKNLIMLLNGVRKNIDVCLINKNAFVYVACIGAYVDISYATPRKLKEKYGRFGYVIYGMQQLNQKINFYNIKYEIDGEKYEGKYSFIFLTNTNRIGGVSNVYDDIKLDDNMFEVLLCNIKNKFDIIKALRQLKKRKFENSSVFTHFKTNKMKIEFDSIPPSWCIDGDELIHKRKTFEITVSKRITMLLPDKNIDKLFINNKDENNN